jgi:hypothetical protein
MWCVGLVRCKCGFAFTYIHVLFPSSAQACLRAWDDGLRRLCVELLLPQADPGADGGWPGGIRQQFR